MSVIIGFDVGEYEVREGTRQIVLSECPFKPTVESLLYVFNITQGKMYYAQAESYAKEVSITVEGLNYILEYQDLSIFPVLGADDKLHIQFGRKNNIQYPISVDGDSTYAKDIWMSGSDTTDWEDVDGVLEHLAIIPFDGLHTKISNSTTDNPKVLLIHFNRTIAAHQVGLGCYDTNFDFSNVKVELLGSGHEIRTAVDDSGNNTKYNSKNYPFEPELFNALRLSFYTADTVTISNITIQKAINTNSFIQIQKPDDTVVNAQGTTQGNFKVSLEEFENAVSVNDNSQLRTTLYDEGGVPAQMDDSTETLQIINYEHHEVHSGFHYFISNVVTLAVSNVLDLQFTTPNTTKWSHMTFQLDCESETEWYIYEGATINTVGTTVTPINNNRNSTNTSDNIIAQITNSSVTNANADTDVSGALQLAHGKVGAGNKSLGSEKRADEVILKQDTVYCIRAVAVAAGYIDFKLSWYEHINAN